MRFSASAALFAILLVPAPAMAGKDKKPVDPDKKICRNFEIETGSVMFHTVCHTAAEWRDINDRNAEDVHAKLDHLPGNSPTRQ